MAMKKSLQKRVIEFIRHNFGDAVVPPGRCCFAMMKLHAAKLARIGEDEGAVTLIQNEMIMLLRAKIGARGLHLTAHAEMQAEPILVRESEKHPLAASFGSQQARSGELLAQGARVGATKNSLVWVLRDFDHTISAAGIPLPPEIFHLGQFRHRSA